MKLKKLAGLGLVVLMVPFSACSKSPTAPEPAPTPKVKVTLEFHLREADPPSYTTIVPGVGPGQYEFIWLGYEAILYPFQDMYTACVLQRDDGRTYISGISGPYEKPSYSNSQCSIWLLKDGTSNRPSVFDFIKGHSISIIFMVGERCMASWATGGYSDDREVNLDCVRASQWTGVSYAVR